MIAARVNGTGTHYLNVHLPRIEVRFAQAGLAEAAGVGITSSRDAGGRIQIFAWRAAMEWERPEFAEISLACEVSSYANAELDGASDEENPDAKNGKK